MESHMDLEHQSVFPKGKASEGLEDYVLLHTHHVKQKIY